MISNSTVLPGSSNVLLTSTRPGPMTVECRGKTIDHVLSTAEHLLIRFTDGSEVRVSWRDNAGKVAGVPCMDEIRRWK